LYEKSKIDGLAKSHEMAKQKFRATRRSGFSGVKAYIGYVEVLKKRCNAVGRTFCDAIKIKMMTGVLSMRKQPGAINRF
jgi:putative protease